MKFAIMRVLLICLFFACLETYSHAQGQQAEYFVPNTRQLNTSILSPEDFFGFPFGRWHLNHEQVYHYSQYLAGASDRIELLRTGRSYEEKPMYLLFISSPENIGKLETIRSAHLEDISGNNHDSSLPAIVWQGFGVHGNEPSATHAAVMAAWYMAASMDQEVEDWLNNIVLIMEPCLNPDGQNRFTSWVNANRSFHSNGHAAERELNEPWPRSRTNHYWFDLNRDWLPVQHPESRSRIPHFHRWKPAIVTDFHEMGSNATYFFQPGVPSRVNPFIPEANQTLTGQIARFHAQALDQIGSLYYTRESFDDYYAGKGSTYPDLNGGIGILFEQASSRGHLQQTIHGPMDFAYTIRNQVITVLSTMRAAVHLRHELREYQRNFFADVKQQASSGNIRAFVVAQPADLQRWYYFLDLMLLHDIEVYRPARDVTAAGKTFKQRETVVIPLEQPQYRLIRSMFDRPLTFTDSIFYDLSTWTVPDAFHLDFAEAGTGFTPAWLGERLHSTALESGYVIGGETNYAYAMPWHYFHAPGALYAMQQLGLLTKVSTRPFEAIPAREKVSFESGTIIIPVQPNLSRWTPEALHQRMERIAESFGTNIYALSTGLSESGIDVGSPNVAALRQPNIALITGEGVFANEAGEVWHLLDQRHRIAITKLDIAQIGRVNLSDFNILIMVDGNYSFSESETEAIKTWVQMGGTLIAQKRAVRWAISADLLRLKNKRSAERESAAGVYANLFPDMARNVLGGAIFSVEADITHPLMFGMDGPSFPVHRGTAVFFEPTGNPYATVARHGENPHLSGYISSENLEGISNSAYLTVHGAGRGRIICFADNPNFRGYWFGTSRLTMNAIFMSQIMTGLSLERGE